MGASLDTHCDAVIHGRRIEGRPRTLFGDRPKCCTSSREAHEYLAKPGRMPEECKMADNERLQSRDIVSLT